MTCATCGGELGPGGDRSPVCDAPLVPRVEGALAAEPRVLTPPARPKARVEPFRDVPGLRRREKTWRDEVQERVRSRRQKRADAGLPLFDTVETAAPAAEPTAPPPSRVESPAVRGIARPTVLRPRRSRISKAITVNPKTRDSMPPLEPVKITAAVSSSNNPRRA